MIEGEDLKALVQLGNGETTIILDEFYSWYMYDEKPGRSVSGAEYVTDVNKVRPPLGPQKG